MNLQSNSKRARTRVLNSKKIFERYKDRLPRFISSIREIRAIKSIINNIKEEATSKDELLDLTTELYHSKDPSLNALAIYLSKELKKGLLPLHSYLAKLPNNSTVGLLGSHYFPEIYLSSSVKEQSMINMESMFHENIFLKLAAIKLAKKADMFLFASEIAFLASSHYPLLQNIARSTLRTWFFKLARDIERYNNLYGKNRKVDELDMLSAYIALRATPYSIKYDSINVYKNVDRILMLGDLRSINP